MILDPLTQLEEAIIAWLVTDGTLATYNWQPWESDAEVTQPRGYVNVSASGDMDAAIQGPILLKCQVVLETLPQTGSHAGETAIVLSMLSGREVIGRINNAVTDGSLKIVGPPEAANVEQLIEREARIRRIEVTYPAIWNVAYV